MALAVHCSSTVCFVFIQQSCRGLLAIWFWAANKHIESYITQCNFQKDSTLQIRNTNSPFVVRLSVYIASCDPRKGSHTAIQTLATLS